MADDERQRARTHGPSLANVGVPVHVVWARKDPIAVPEIARRVAEEAGTEVAWLDELGHYPMLEDPAAWAAAIDSAIGR